MNLKNWQLDYKFIRNGLRAAFAVFIAMLISYIFQLKFPYWITMTTIVVMQTTIGASIIFSCRRIVGTIFGLLVGLMFVMFFHKQFSLLIFSFPILIFAVCYSASFSNILSTFFMSIGIGMIFSYIIPDAWTFIFWRINDTILGAIIAVGSILFIFPNRAEDDLGHALVTGLIACQELFSEIIDNMTNGFVKKSDDFAKQMFAIENTLFQKRKHFANAAYETFAIISMSDAAYDLVLCEERMHSLLLGLLLIYRNMRSQKLSEDFVIVIKNFESEMRGVVNSIAVALRDKKQLPNLGCLYKSLFSVRDVCFQEQSEDTTAQAKALFYRNFLGFANEIKHIREAFLQKISE